MVEHFSFFLIANVLTTLNQRFIFCILNGSVDFMTCLLRYIYVRHCKHFAIGLVVFVSFLATKPNVFLFKQEKIQILKKIDTFFPLVFFFISFYGRLKSGK